MDSETHEPWFRAWMRIAVVPLTAIILGLFAQYSINRATIAKDYVALAVQLLQSPSKTGSDTALRSWAVDLLDRYSAVKLAVELKQSLRDGTTTFPRAETVQQLLSELNSQIEDSGKRQRAAIAGTALPRRLVPEETFSILEELSKTPDPEISKAAQDLLNKIRKQQ